MNRMSALVKRYRLCVLAIVKMWHFQRKFDQHLSLYCGSATPKFKTGLLWVMIFKNSLTILAYSFFKYILKSSSNIFPIETTWRKKGMFSLFETSVNGNVTICICYNVSPYQCIMCWRQGTQILVLCTCLTRGFQNIIYPYLRFALLRKNTLTKNFTRFAPNCTP